MNHWDFLAPCRLSFDGLLRIMPTILCVIDQPPIEHWLTPCFSSLKRSPRDAGPEKRWGTHGRIPRKRTCPNLPPANPGCVDVPGGIASGMDAACMMTGVGLARGPTMYSRPDYNQLIEQSGLPLFREAGGRLVEHVDRRPLRACDKLGIRRHGGFRAGHRVLVEKPGLARSAHRRATRS